MDPEWLDGLDGRMNTVDKIIGPSPLPDGLADAIIHVALLRIRRHMPWHKIVYTPEAQLVYRVKDQGHPYVSAFWHNVRDTHYPENIEYETVIVLSWLRLLNADTIGKLLKIFPQRGLDQLVVYMRDRVPEYEEEISKLPRGIAHYYYLTRFPEAKQDWMANGWLDWLDT